MRHNYLPNDRFDNRMQLERAGQGLTRPMVVPDSVQDQGNPAGLSDLTAPLWRRKGTIAAAASLGLLLGLVASLLMTPVYRARASLQLEGFSDDQFLRSVTPISPVVPNASAENYLQNEVKVLESDSLARRVADKLGTRSESKPPGAARALLARLRNQVGFLRPWPTTPEEQRIQHVKNALTVRTSLQSQVVELFYDAKDPEIAARGANIVASEFMDMNREARAQLVQDTTDWLSKQAAELKAKLENSNRQLQDFAQRSGLVFAGSESTLAEDRMRQVQESLARAEAERAAKQSRYEAATSGGDLLSDPLTTGTLRQYETDLAKMRAQLADLETLYTPTNYKVQRLKAQIAETEAAIAKERQAIVGRMHTDYQAADRLERLLSTANSRQLKTVEQQMIKERQYNVLKSEVDTTQRLYESTLQKVKEASVASALRTTNIRVIDHASVPSVPYSPRTSLNMAIGFLIGTIGGVGLALMGEKTGKVKRPGEAMLLDIPELGVIPSAGDARALDLPKQSLIRFRPRSGGELALATWDQDTSLLSESFRSTVTSILFGAGIDTGQKNRTSRSQSRVLVVTSIDAMEGKTTVLTNVGIALAETKRRVLLIDADLRRPRLHDLFGLANDWGLTDVLRSYSGDFADTPLKSLVLPTRIPDVWVLPSGPGNAAISGLLHSADLNALLQRFRREFDLVLVDTPPLALYQDARVLGRMSDGLVMVVRANRRSREELKAAYLRLMQDEIPVLGTILNDWRMGASDTRAYGRYYNRYQRSNEGA